MPIASWIEIGRMDELAQMDSPIHRLDARTKAVVTLAFIVTVMSIPSREVSMITPFFLYPIALTSLGRIPMRPLLKKILIAAPFALVIGIFNPLMDKEPVTSFGPILVTGGWLSFVSIMLRFVLTVWAALALVASTGMYKLGTGLERLGIPRLFVSQLLFLYRYLFVVSDEAAKMMRSVALRSGDKSHLRLREYSSLVGHLLLRSMDRAERIYRAMTARCFNGEIRTIHPSNCHASDVLFLCGCLLCFVVCRTWNIADGIGFIITGGKQ
jgi:cobalt/nickel transport system permease protein